MELGDNNSFSMYYSYVSTVLEKLFRIVEPQFCQLYKCKLGLDGILYYFEFKILFIFNPEQYKDDLSYIPQRYLKHKRLFCVFDDV